MRLPTPRNALLLSALVACLVLGMKLAAWRYTGSVGQLSDALESLVNLAGAIFALAMVTYARRPPDEAHPYGHGKAEYFSAAFEGGLIFFAAVAIIYAAVGRLLQPQALAQIGFGTLLSVVASVLNLAMARLLLRVAEKHRSIALEADARHLITDVWTTAGVIAGVLLAYATGLNWFDPLVAILVALNILWEGGRLVRRAVDGLMDRALDDSDQAALTEALAQLTNAHGSQIGELLTRAAGAQRFAYLVLLVPGDWSVTRAHDLADQLETAALKLHVELKVHVEPIVHAPRH